MWVVAGLGFVAVAFSLLVSFFPPTQLPVGNPVIYVVLVAAGLIVFVSAALMIYRFRKPSWHQHAAAIPAAESSFAGTAAHLPTPNQNRGTEQ